MSGWSGEAPGARPRETLVDAVDEIGSLRAQVAEARSIEMSLTRDAGVLP